MKNFIVFSILFLIIINSFGQNNQLFYFKANGTINADTGNISLVFYSEYTPSGGEIVTQVKNHKFSFSGHIPAPQGVFILYNDRYMSADFIIDTGRQMISVNVDSLRKVPSVQNRIMGTEYIGYRNYFSTIKNKRILIDREYDSLQKVYTNQIPDTVKLSFTKRYNELYRENDRTLLQYVTNHSNSNIAFWQLIKLMSWGYEPIFDSIYNAFTPKLKNSYAGKVLDKKLKTGKLLSIGNLFPDVQCTDTKGEKFSPGIFLKNKFTLVDFWYSHCSPCRAQFDDLKSMYKKYNSKGFEIVGVSVDKAENKNDWMNTINKEQLVWQQYWDKEGKEANRLSINVFPTNFLIDSTGKIIAKNISMEELDKFLNEKL